MRARDDGPAAQALNPDGEGDPETPANGESRPLASIVRRPVIAYGDEPLRVVVNRVAETGRTDLPVVDRASRRRLLGSITLHDMLKARVRHLEEESRRERLLPLSLVVPRWLRSSRGIPPSGRLPVERGEND